MSNNYSLASGQKERLRTAFYLKTQLGKVTQKILLFVSSTVLIVSVFCPGHRKLARVNGLFFYVFFCHTLLSGICWFPWQSKFIRFPIIHNHIAINLSEHVYVWVFRLCKTKQKYDMSVLCYCSIRDTEMTE